MSEGSIQKVAVLGAGTRGAGLAAQLANGGVQVLLLDTLSENEDHADRSFRAKVALAEMAEAKPSPFMSPRYIQMITPGNTTDDFDKLAEADWIVEAIEEDLTSKTELYERIEAVRKNGSVVSTTSARFAWAALVEGRAEDFRRDFILTSFSYPMRRRRLAALVAGEETADATLVRLADFCDKKLGRTVVYAHDAPGLIVDRLGLFYIQTVINAVHELGVTLEVADLLGRRIGFPVFQSLDEMGIDKWLAMASAVSTELQDGDAFASLYREQPLFAQMVRAGYSGKTGRGGFYRKRRTPEGERAETLNLQTGGYEVAHEIRSSTTDLYRQDWRVILSSLSDEGRFAWRVLSQLLSYVAGNYTLMADHVFAIDQAMREGAGWIKGPFELLDAIGVDWFMARLREDGRPIPAFMLKAAGRSFYDAVKGKVAYLSREGAYEALPRPSGVLLLKDIQYVHEPVAQNADASVWDIGDGVLCFTFTSKMHTLSPDLLDLMDETLSVLEEQAKQTRPLWNALVVYNEDAPFSAGLNLKVLADAMQAKNWAFIESYMKKANAVLRRMRFAPFPTVVAVKGFTVGGGCEMLMHAASAQASAESRIGLVERSTGFVPGWGGAMQLLGRALVARRQFGGDIPPVNAVFETIAEAKISDSAAEAVEMHYLRPSDGVTMNEDRLLFDARQRALSLVPDYKPPERWPLTYAGAVGRAALELVIEGYKVGQVLSPHDLVVCRAVANVLCGAEGDPSGAVTEEDMLAVTLRELMALIKNAQTQARVNHFLKTGGEWLRN